MAIEYKTWQDEVKDPNNLRSTFCAHTASLLYRKMPYIVRGNICVGGPGEECPERWLMCTARSGHKELEPSVASVTLCDESENAFSNITSPGRMFKDPVTVIKSPQNFKPAPGRAYFYHGRIENFFAECQRVKFNVIMLFCIDGLEEGFKNGLGRLISNNLGDGGYVMGSSLFSDKDINSIPGLAAEIKCVHMNSLGRLYTKIDKEHNLAFIARKG